MEVRGGGVIRVKMRLRSGVMLVSTVKVPHMTAHLTGRGWNGGVKGRRGHGVKVTRWRSWGDGVLGCWGVGVLGWRGGVVAGSRAAHDALSEAARNNDLLALLIHLGATRALTLERRHLQLHSWQGRLLASMHSAAQETGKRPEDGRRT